MFLYRIHADAVCLKVCGSGLEALNLARQAILAGTSVAIGTAAIGVSEAGGGSVLRLPWKRDARIYVSPSGIGGCACLARAWALGSLSLSRSVHLSLVRSSGDVDIVLAGGQESMTDSPHVLSKSREGQGHSCKKRGFGPEFCAISGAYHKNFLD